MNQTNLIAMSVDAHFFFFLGESGEEVRLLKKGNWYHQKKYLFHYSII